MCDTVRYDIAMLILPDVFEKTWGLRPASFWHNAVEQGTRANPALFSWPKSTGTLEWILQQQGFEYVRLYLRQAAL